MTGGVLLIGASGLAREVLAAGIRDVAGILDDAVPPGTVVNGVPVLGRSADAAHRAESLLVCVGRSRERRRVVQRLAAFGVTAGRYATFVAVTSRVGSTSAIGPGTILLDDVVVTADVRLGSHVVAMPHATITHDDVLEDFATIAAGVSLGGRVRVGEAAYVGMNAALRERVTVGRDATVGMGAVVLMDVPDGQTWVGVPARHLEVVV